MFGANKGTNYEGLSIPSLSPGIHEVELIDVKKEKTTRATGEQGKTILTFTYKKADGTMHQHTEYDVLPTDKDAEKKAKEMTTRVGHVMTKFISKDIVDANASTTFEAYADWVIASLGGSFKGVKDLELKIVGNVYEGKATTQVPLFPPFLARKSSPTYKGLAFDAYQNGQNAKYAAFHNATPDAESGNTASSTTSSGARIDADF